VSVLTLLLSLGVAQAGGLIQHYSDPAEAHYTLCRRTEMESGEDVERIVGVWKACLSEAERLGYSSVLPPIRGNLALASALLDASRSGASTEAEQLERALIAVARQRDIQFRLEKLAEIYRRYLVTDRGRSRMASYRDVSFRWTNQASIDDGLVHVNEVVRRYMEDAGFRWTDYGHQSASRADLVCKGTVRARVKNNSPEALDDLPVVETIIAIETVRLPGVEKEIQGFLTTASAQATTEQGALDSSLHQAAQAMAATMLHRVIQASFATAIDIEDYLDPVEEDF
jgi:hypothetical protein